MLRYLEINHSQAFAKFKKGQDVTLCPSNLCPGYPWHSEVTINRDRYEGEYPTVEETWKMYKIHFKFHNCVSRETGLSIKYYVSKEV